MLRSIAEDDALRRRVSPAQPSPPPPWTVKTCLICPCSLQRRHTCRSRLLPFAARGESVLGFDACGVAIGQPRLGAEASDRRVAGTRSKQRDAAACSSSSSWPKCCVSTPSRRTLVRSTRSQIASIQAALNRVASIGGFRRAPGSAPIFSAVAGRAMGTSVSPKRGGEPRPRSARRMQSACLHHGPASLVHVHGTEHQRQSRKRRGDPWQPRREAGR